MSHPSTSLAVVLALAACSLTGCSPPPPRPAPAASVMGAPSPSPPPDLLPIGPDGYAAVFTSGDASYLVLGRVIDPGDDPALAAEAARAWGPDGAARVVPVRDQGRYRRPDTAVVVDAAGPREVAVVGEVVLIGIGCASELALVGVRLRGRLPEIAPIARIGGGFPADLRWRPLGALGPAHPLFAAGGRITDPVHRRHVADWLAEPDVQAARHASDPIGVTYQTSIDAGGERLEQVAAEFAGGPRTPLFDGECEAEHLGARTVTYLREGERETVVEVPDYFPLLRGDGVLTWHGRIVAIATGGDHYDTALWTLDRDPGRGRATLTQRFEQPIWIGSEMCPREHDDPRAWAGRPSCLGDL